MIRESVKQILRELPDGVHLVAVVKARQPREIAEAVSAGVTIVGENYVQEAERAHEFIGNRVKWHFIGHLQKNKAKKAVRIFDMIETVDSVEVAREIDRRCAQIGKIMPVLAEVNSGREKRKCGVLPERVEELIREISSLRNIRVEGLMTIGPRRENPQESRPYFAETREIFDKIKELDLPDADMRYLSMGMTNSYRVAIEEGANIVRLGDKIFGKRSCQKVEPVVGTADNRKIAVPVKEQGGEE